jgi:hypothetical protein
LHVLTVEIRTANRASVVRVPEAFGKLVRPVELAGRRVDGHPAGPVLALAGDQGVGGACHIRQVRAPDLAGEIGPVDPAVRRVDRDAAQVAARRGEQGLRCAGAVQVRDADLP